MAKVKDCPGFETFGEDVRAGREAQGMTRKVLAGKGLHVLLVERHKLPRYKSCSGVLIQKTMDLVRRYFGEDVPLSATCTPIENRGMAGTFSEMII